MEGDWKLRLAMAQMRMSASVEDNLNRTLSWMEEANAAGADMIFFPEVQFSPFFPQYEGQCAEQWLLSLDSRSVQLIQKKCRDLELWASPNLYLSLDGKHYDASLMIDAKGKICGISKMVYIAQAPCFFEQDYYTPSEDGFHVYDTPFGRIGVVICFDRHIPLSIHDCALQGADLILIPTANLTSEPLELFEWEIRVQAFQNTAFVAMCNRVGPEGAVTFAGNSLIATPDGSLLFRADGAERLCMVDIPLEQAEKVRKERSWLALSQTYKSEGRS